MCYLTLMQKSNWFPKALKQKISLNYKTENMPQKQENWATDDERFPSISDLTVLIFFVVNEEVRALNDDG